MITLALNMIVGKNDAAVLDRCLSSIGNLKKLFSEITIVNTWDVLDVSAVIARHRGTEIKRPWVSDRYPHGDFAGARNAALAATTSDYVTWLDCDDLPPTEKEYAALVRAIDQTRRDFYVAPYHINIDEHGKYQSVFGRERVFRNAKNIRWLFPVHEQVDLSGYKAYANIDDFIIRHAPEKDPASGIRRNLAIAENEITHFSSTHPHILFNYAKDLLFLDSVTGATENQGRAIEILDDLLYGHGVSDEIMPVLASMIALNLAYVKNGSRKVFNVKNIFEANLFSRLAASFDDVMAEPHVVMGDAILNDPEKDPRLSIAHYRRAMRVVPGRFAVQHRPFYRAIPAERLCQVHRSLGQPELALWYNRIYGEASGNPRAAEMKKELLRTLSEET